MTYGFSIPFLFVPAVAVASAGGKGVLPLKICHAARFAHGVVQTAQGRSQIVQPQLPHQNADTALGKPGLVAAAVGVLIKVHIPRVGVPVGGLQRCRRLQSGNALGGELFLAAFTAEPAHRLCHHGLGVILRQPIHIGTLRHGENEGPQHGAAHETDFKAVPLLKLRQAAEDLLVFCFRPPRDRLRRLLVIPQHIGQLCSKGARKQRPHPPWHSHVVHSVTPLPSLRVSHIPHRSAERMPSEQRFSAPSSHSDLESAGIPRSSTCCGGESPHAS